VEIPIPWSRAKICTVAPSLNQRSTSTAWENTPRARRPRRVPRCTRSASSRRATCWASARGTSRVAGICDHGEPLIRDLIFANPVLPRASRLSRAGPVVRTRNPDDHSVRKPHCHPTKEKTVRGEKLSHRYVQHVFETLRSALSNATREELIGRNVARLVKAPSAVTTTSSR
jgi:hypothetical protein